MGWALLGAGLLLALGALLRHRLRAPAPYRSRPDLRGRTAVVTGGSGGIGEATARGLARCGARVVLAARCARRGEAAARRIRTETGNPEVLFMPLDLASLRSVRAFASAFLRQEPHLHLLVNNAGVSAGGTTEDGFSLTFQVNHLGHFLLTQLLLERLQSSAPSRVVIVASAAHRAGRLRPAALGRTPPGPLPTFQGYCDSKLANVLHARELATRLQGTQVTSYAVHPGGCCGSDVKQYVYGGWAWAWWCITDTQRISLEIMTLQPRCEDVETAEGVALTVTGVAQVKIMTEKELLAVACEQFLGKNVQDVKNVVLQTLEGHLRSILGTLTVEQIYQDRDQFAKLVREVAAPDVGRMGIEILSFTIKDVYDKVDYLSSLGKTQTAAVRRDADIGVAEAERDAGIREAECKKEMLDVKFMADTKIADSRRAFELQKAAFTEEVNIKTAEAQLAYELQSAREQQKIRQEEIEIEVVQRKKQIDVEEKEIIRKEKELIATVKRPAEAEAYRIQQIAEGEKVRQVLMAQAEAEKIRKMGEAEAFVIEAIGMAEAERMKLKAEALQRYGEAAQLALVLDALPEVRRGRLSPAPGERWRVPRLGTCTQGPRPVAPWLRARHTLLPSPDCSQSGCSPLQSGRDRCSQRGEQQRDIRGEPPARRDPRLRACHHRRGPHEDSPDPESHRGPGMRPKASEDPSPLCTRHQLPSTLGNSFYIKDNRSLVFKLWCLIL
ncbi:flotillin-2 isoform X2 [Cygnus atratus]|uniref:flotillin-2 isoform X2 n=1 Tax=Cygnus atratus TaxID=8868 RepID=UPI0021B704A5|nr:flotillin-2 isoform X2 [Cygnus atratus]